MALLLLKHRDSFTSVNLHENQIENYHVKVLTLRKLAMLTRNLLSLKI